MKTLAIIVAIALSGTLVDQGAPGNRGPWPVVVVGAPPVGSVVVSRLVANPTLSLAYGSGCADDTVTVTGAAVGQTCSIQLPTLAGVGAECFVPGTNSVTVRACGDGTSTGTFASSYQVALY